MDPSYSYGRSTNIEAAMKFQTEDRSGVKVVRIAGNLDGIDSEPLTAALSELVEHRGAGIVINLADVKFINSTGLSALVTFTAQANTHETKLVLASLSPFVAGVLETTRLDRFFDVFPTVEAAITQLQRPA
jgi:anti-sigma B factor antagonist